MSKLRVKTALRPAKLLQGKEKELRLWGMKGEESHSGGRKRDAKDALMEREVKKVRDYKLRKRLQETRTEERTQKELERIAQKGN